MMLNMNNATLKEGKMLIIGDPRSYRADCKMGMFKIGANHVVGQKLTLEPITAQLVERQLFNYAFQKWVEILFVDEHGMVSSLLLKGESLTNFLETYRKTVISGQNMTAIQVEARMADRANEYGKYFAVEFEVLGDGKYSEDIQSFANDLPVGVFRLDSLPEGNGNGYDNSHAHHEPKTTAVAPV